MRREFVTNSPERRGSATARGATWGSARRPGGEGKMWERAFAVAAAARTGEAARAGLGLAGWSKFSGLWCIRAAPTCLVPGPG